MQNTRGTDATVIYEGKKGKNLLKNLKGPTHPVHHNLHFLLEFQTNFLTLQHESSPAKRLSEQKPETNGVCSFFLLLFFCILKADWLKSGQLEGRASQSAAVQVNQCCWHLRRTRKEEEKKLAVEKCSFSLHKLNSRYFSAGGSYWSKCCVCRPNKVLAISSLKLDSSDHLCPNCGRFGPKAAKKILQYVKVRNLENNDNIWQIQHTKESLQ